MSGERYGTPPVADEGGGTGKKKRRINIFCGVPDTDLQE
jgi:hypothetical protein